MMHENNNRHTDQIQFVCVEQLVPKDHLLRKIDRYIDFGFIYPLVEPLYSKDTGRPSLDPVVLFKLVFIQYLFGIKSMRQTIKDVEVNIAYRWFLGLGFNDPVPHFSTFSQNYARRFKETGVFEQIFLNILSQAMNHHLVRTDVQFIDATHVKAYANRHKTQKAKLHKETKWYQEQLDKEINQERHNHDKKDLNPPKNPPTNQVVEKTESTTDPESGLFHKGEHKEVFAYSVQTSCDRNGWILGYEVYPGNLHDSITFHDFFTRKIEISQPAKLVMDAGYKTPANAKYLIDRNIQPVFPYTAPKRSKKAENLYYRKAYRYDKANNQYICPEGGILKYTTTNRDGYHEFKSNSKICIDCPNLKRCTKSKNHQKVITRHIWQDYIDITEKYRLTECGKAEYKLRKETIERQFGSAKEYHGFRYTNMKGIAKMGMKAALTFACLNMKKLANMLSLRDGGFDGSRYFFAFFSCIEKRRQSQKWVCRRSDDGPTTIVSGTNGAQFEL